LHVFYIIEEKKKKEFLNKIKTTEEFNIIKENPGITKKLVNNDFFEFLLPYVMLHNIDEYKNVELIGLGFYESNQEILSRMKAMLFNCHGKMKIAPNFKS